VPDAVLTVLGSGTLVPDAARSSAAHHVRTGRASILLDCGSGTLHGFERHGVDWRALTHVALTHFHYDHVGDLPALLVALKYGVEPPRDEPLTLLGPSGVEARLARWSEILGIAFLDQGFPLHVVEIGPHAGYVEPGCFELSAHPSAHTEPSLGLRLDTPGGSVAYTGDTGPSSELAAFLGGAGVLVAECAHPDERPVDGHLTPATLAAFAEIARPGLLVVTHVYPPHRPADAVRAVAQRYAGRVVEGRDGMVVRIRGGEATVDLPGRAVYT